MTYKQAGFSLIEVLIAFLLIGVAALGLVKLQSFVESKADLAKHNMQALHKVENQLEEFRQRGISSAVYTYSLNDVHGECNSMSKQTATSSIQLTCQSTFLLSDSLSEVKLQAYWLDRQNNERDLIIETMISKYSEFDM